MTKALIVIDMFVKDIGGRHDEKELVANQKILINKFREKGFPVIFTGAKPDAEPNPVYDKIWGNEYGESSLPEKESKELVKKNTSFLPELLELGFDLFVQKENYSAFFNTNLEKYCKKQKISELYFAGISSGCCVNYSGVDAMYRRIQSIIISDATSSTDPEQHKINIKNFETFIGPSMTTKEVIESLD